MFENFTSVDLLFSIALGGFIIWELIGFVRSWGKIKLEGKIYGRWVSLGLLMVLVAVAAWRQWDQISSVWLLLVGMAVSSVLFMFLKTGFGETGYYARGRFFPFSKIVYYSIDRETEKDFTLRMNTGFKEFSAIYNASDKELVMAYLAKGKVADMKSAMSR